MRISGLSLGLGLGILGVLGVWGCNSVPVYNLEKSFTIGVKQKAEVGEKVKIDFLWVIDNSTSMCEEQIALTKNFGTFTKTLTETVNIDARVAVTSMDMHCDMKTHDTNSSRGVFSQKTAKGFPPSCFAKEIYECKEDVECNALGDPGNWNCKPSLPSDSCLVNPNGSVNTYCQRRCSDDAECQSKLGDENYVCSKPSGNKEDWGCLLPPQTDGCPSKLPAFLSGTEIQDFGCLATIGVNQLKCFKFEQGLSSALAALDKTGANSEQSKSFLRDDAYLVIIFVSDEDDCSVPTGKTIHEDDYDNCATLGDTNHGGKLVPVSHFINRYKSLKSDASKVIVAAIAGDSTKTDLGEVTEEREAFMESKAHKKDCYHQSYICSSDVGKADWGSRYLELAEGFGINGIFANICDESGIGPALEQIAATIIRVINKICLPRAVMNADSIVVVKHFPDGTSKTLVEGDEGDFKLIPGGDDCSEGDEQLPAISLKDPPQPEEKFTITYQGDPGFE